MKGFKDVRSIVYTYTVQPTTTNLKIIYRKTVFNNRRATFDHPVRCMYNLLLMNPETHRAEVAKALQSLEASIRRFTDALGHRPVTATIEGAATVADSVRRACEAYAAIDYEMDDEVGDSVICLGLIGVTSEILKRAEAVNEEKLALKKLFAPLQRVRIRVPVKGASGTKAITALRVILRNIQRSDLNIHAAYRKIPILKAPPATVTYTRANTRSVYRKSVDEIASMLANMQSPIALEDRERLARLDQRHSFLALTRYRYENTRANVLYTHLDARGRGRVQIGAELPLIYATGRHPVAPEVQFPDREAASGARRTRTPLIESKPFLRSLPVYRYL